MKAKELYAHYDKKTQDYMQCLFDCIEQDYGEIPSSWRISLDLIADNYEVYLKAKNSVITDGVTIGSQRNPQYTTMISTQQMLFKLLSSFALTPMTRSKMKNLKSENKQKDFNDLLEV